MRTLWLSEYKYQDNSIHSIAVAKFKTNVLRLLASIVLLVCFIGTVYASITLFQLATVGGKGTYYTFLEQAVVSFILVGCGALLWCWRRYRLHLFYSILTAIFVAVCVIVLSGTTNLARQLAYPLLRQDTLSPADVIVVSSGIRWDLTAAHTASLIQRGYAENVLLLSSLTKPYVQAAVTQARISPHAITDLSVTSQNTAHDARMISTMLRERQYERVIIVSAPYHMLRLSLTLRKHNADRFSCAPVPEDIWYAPEHWRNYKGYRSLFWIRQIWLREVLHEYLGLAFYWLKGDI